MLRATQSDAPATPICERQHTLPNSPRGHPPSPRGGGVVAAAAVRRRRACTAAALLAAGLALWWLARYVLQLFHWAEHRVDRNSTWHQFLFFLVTLPFHTGLPVPIVHQAWAVAIGCFFGVKAYPILVASLSVGVPLPFVIGRRLAAGCGGKSHSEDGEGDGTVPPARLLQLLPAAMVAYLTPLRRAIALQPVRSSFLLMWAPLPTSSLPLLLGILVPRWELPLGSFVLGALPSKLLHFAADVLVGIEAGSLAKALDAHDDPADVIDDGAPPAASGKHARTIAVGTLVLTVSFVLAMGYTMHQALKELKEKDDTRRGEQSYSSPLLATAV